MNKEVLIFSDIDIEFHYCENLVWIDDVDIDKTLISNMVSLDKKGCKYYNDYKDDDYETKRLCIMHPKMSGFVKIFDKTYYIVFFYWRW